MMAVVLILKVEKKKELYYATNYSADFVMPEINDSERVICGR